MKFLDYVRVTGNKYEEDNIFKGDMVTIMAPLISDDGKMFVMKENPETHGDEWDAGVYVGDLEECEEGYSSNITDEELLEDLPNKDPSWWCKVEDGYIWNLKGEKKTRLRTITSLKV